MTNLRKIIQTLVRCHPFRWWRGGRDGSATKSRLIDKTGDRSGESDPLGCWMKRLLDRGVILGIPCPLLNSTHGRRTTSFHQVTLSFTSFRTMVAVTTAPRLTELSFPITPVPKNPLGEGKYIRTAAALIIGCVPIETPISKRMAEPSGQRRDSQRKGTGQEYPILRHLLFPTRD